MDNETNAYKLVEVKIGKEEAMGRPVEWDREIYTSDGKDYSGEDAVPTKFETTCPHCGQRIAFDRGFSNIVCELCGVGEFKRDINLDNPFKTLDIDALLNGPEDIPESKLEKAPLDCEDVDLKSDKNPEQEKLDYSDYVQDGPDDPDDINIEELLK